MSQQFSNFPLEAWSSSLPGIVFAMAAQAAANTKKPPAGEMPPAVAPDGGQRAPEAALPRSFGPGILPFGSASAETPSPQADFLQRLAHLRRERDEAERQAYGVAYPSAPSGYARAGAEGIAAGLAILGNLMDRQHRAGTLGYSAFRSGLAGAQRSLYEDAARDAQARQQRALAHAGKVSRQIEDLRQEPPPEPLDSGAVFKEPAAIAWPEPANTQDELPDYLSAAVRQGRLTREQARRIDELSTLVDPEFRARTADAYTQVAGPAPDGKNPPSGSAMVDAYARLWRTHHATISRLDRKEGSVLQPSLSPEEIQQRANARRQQAVFERKLVELTGLQNILFGRSPNQDINWRTPTGQVLARLLGRMHLAAGIPRPEVSKAIKRLTGLDLDF